MGAADLGTRRYVGARVRHVEHPHFLTGNGQYVDDIKIFGALHCAFVRSVHGHARITSVDVEQAKRVPGVVGVFTAADLIGTLPIETPCTYPTYQTSAQELLVSEKVRMVGDPIVAVVAEDRYQAEDGCNAVEVKYEPLPAINSIEKALADDAPAVHDSIPDNVFVWFHRVNGDPDAAFARADFDFELELRTQRYAAVPLEARAVLARFDESVDELTVWMSNQCPHLMRTGLARFLRMPENRIRVIAPDVGGGFGQKSLMHTEDVVIPILARKLGRPVKWAADRREDLQTSMHAREQLHRLKVAAMNDGRVIGIKAEIYADNGAYSSWPMSAALDCGQAADNVPGPYAIENYERKASAVVTNKAPVGPYRGVGRPHACMDIERVMDEVARRVHLDPAEVRRRNFIREFPYVTAGDFHIESGDYHATLDLALREFGYEERQRAAQELRADGIYRGIGIACNVEQSAHGKSEWERKGVLIAPGYDTAEMRVEPDGKVSLAVGLHSHGQGQKTTMAQIAADQLGLSPDDVEVVFGDTARVPYGFGSFSSRGTVYCGGATIQAAQAIREKAMTIAADMLEVSPEDLTLEDQRFTVRGSTSSFVSWADVARRANHEPAKLPAGVQPGLDATRKYMAAEWGSYSNAVHVVEVEVDVDTGQVSLGKYLVVEDCGVMVNPTGAEGQIHGGIAQGLGGVFLEELPYDDSGQLLAGTFLDYLLPGFNEVPDVEIHHYETPSPINVGGFKGMGEGGCINPAPAIANAIIHALEPLASISINQTPITPELILDKLAEGGYDGRARQGA